MFSSIFSLSTQSTCQAFVSRTRVRTRIPQSSSSRRLASFSVGDSVRVAEDDDNSRTDTINGVIQDIRGRGWYTVQLADSRETIKVRARRLRPTKAATKDAASAPTNISIPPSPTIIDLDALLHQSAVDPSHAHQQLTRQVKHHRSFDKWVVFTDLHCSPSTLDTTLEVLNTVHRMARDRNAGVLFLGDFWHHRWTLRVDCLNAVLESLNKWTVPLVMIPGNHDQISLGGHRHALTPLENAFRLLLDGNGASIAGPLIFSHPTKFHGALFVPHIRDHATMESILQSEHAMTSNALFVHADVTGAQMNDLIVSTGGVPPSLFPSDKKVYSGHFHKPHSIQQIEYIGSPYEVSLAEAQQPKALVVLDASDDWNEIERIPVFLGKKHFRVDRVEDIMEYSVATQRRDDGGRSTVLSGDRIVLSLTKKEQQDLERVDMFESKLKELRESGVLVELRELADSTLGNHLQPEWHAQAEELSPKTLWSEYLASEVSRGILASEERERIQEAGRQLMEELGMTDSSLASSDSKAADLTLESVTIQGFGPFKESASYPLSDRGLVLLRGTNRDGGSDSNGSGKSSLAASILWGLTGEIDPRPVQDMKVAHVINDACRAARVTIKGRLNEDEFIITRSKTSSKGALTFIFAEEDLSTQSVKETQAVIEEKLGVGAQTLGRSVFHGQHAFNGLLEATDSKIKEELSLIVPLDEWQACVKFCRKSAREAAKLSAEREGMRKMRADDLVSFQKLRDTAEGRVLEVSSLLKLREEALSAHMYVDETLDGSRTVVDLERLLEDAKAHYVSLEAEMRQMVIDLEDEMDQVSQKYADLQLVVEEAALAVQEARRLVDQCSFVSRSVEKDIQTIEKTWSISIATMESDISLPTVCPTCQQPLCGDGEHGANMRAKLEQEISSAVQQVENAGNDEGEAKKRLHGAEKRRDEEQSKLASIRGELGRLSLQRDDLSLRSRQERAQARENIDSLSNELVQAMRREKTDPVLAALKQEMESTAVELRMAQRAQDQAEKDFIACQKAIGHIEVELAGFEDENKLMSCLADAFGQRGIQAFVMGRAVSSLQAVCRSYLDELSDGALQLQLELDDGDRLLRKALVRSADGSYLERPLASLSGGQWRRCSLALNLAFADLIAQRGKLRPSLVILDEPLTHLDRSGRTNVGRVLRKMLRDAGIAGGMSVSTILIILQDLAGEELENSFDRIDEVVKRDGSSIVIVDEDGD